MKNLLWTLWKLWNRYPARALIYVCNNNGVIGAVRAEDYDKEIRRMRKEFAMNRWPTVPVRPQVYPVFLFSNNESKTCMTCGNEENLKNILINCAVEFRDFVIPPINGGPVDLDYFGGYENVAFDSKFPSWSIVTARKYLHEGQH